LLPAVRFGFSAALNDGAAPNSHVMAAGQNTELQSTL
jgi:hypothetical protein